MIVCIATGVSSVLDDRTENFGRELIMNERHKTNNVIGFADVDIKFIEQHTIV